MSDAKDIAMLERLCFDDFWDSKTIEEQLSHDNVIYVLSDDGFALGSVCADEAELYRIGTQPEMRKKGLGTRILMDFERLCKEKGALKIFLEVRSMNLPAIKLYERCGFEKIAVRKKYYVDDDALIYRKEPLD